MQAPHFNLSYYFAKAINSCSAYLFKKQAENLLTNGISITISQKRIKINRSFPGLVLLLLSLQCVSQQSGNFDVGGDIDKYYPVSFVDGNWANNKPTELVLGRSFVHQNSSWLGSFMATFKFHANNWGNSSEFINADIYSYNSYPSITPYNFIAGWKDVTSTNSDSKIIIWLKGGGTTYFYSANTTVTPQVHDGTQYPLPYQETNGVTDGIKTAVELYVNPTGINGKTALFDHLSVNGEVLSRKVKVTQTGWPDYVFTPGYHLPALSDVERFIKTNSHLPGVQSAEEVGKQGLDLGESQAVLLKKIEELTLYLIEQDKKIEAQQREIDQIKSKRVKKNKKNK